MPETATSDASAETAEGSQEQTSTGSQSSQSDQSETDWKSHAKKWEARAKENAEAARKLAELEEKDKTEQQKLADKLAKAEQARQDAERSLLRSQVAVDKGLSPKLAARLQGDTLKEIEADADALLEDLKISSPKADLKQGDRGAENPGQDVDAWIRREAGR